MRPRKPRGGLEEWLYSFINLGVKWSTPRNSRFIPEKRVPGPAWTGAENLTTNRESIPGPTALSRPTLLLPLSVFKRI